MKLRVMASCGSEVSGGLSPRSAQRGRAVRKRVVLFPVSAAHRPGICARSARQGGPSICAAALPLAVSSVSTTGLTAGKDRHFIREDFGHESE